MGQALVKYPNPSFRHQHLVAVYQNKLITILALGLVVDLIRTSLAQIQVILLVILVLAIIITTIIITLLVSQICMVTIWEVEQPSVQIVTKI